jgi:hypothetical protein
MAQNPSLVPALYLAAVTWSIIGSSKRWMTLLWVVVTLAAVLGVFGLCSLIWPSGAAIFGDLAAICGMLVSGFVGINYMRAHKRPAAPKV